MQNFDAMRIKTSIRIIVIMTFLIPKMVLAQQTITKEISTENTDSLKLAFEEQRMEMAKKMDRAVITSMIAFSQDEGYGYYIFVDGQMVIDQRSIPAVAGKKGFSTKEEAERTAAFAISKIRAGYVPPTISTEELRQLAIKLP